jgi:succinate-semialdehyde dehydrogenase/glutarate-semialdehyde dehydrogenase
VTSPATEQVLGRAPDCGAGEAARAGDTVVEAFQEWRASTPFERSALLRRWHDLIDEHREGLARLIAAEVGKPIRQARDEVDYAKEFVASNGADALRCGGEVLASTSADRRQFVMNRPVGPAFGITPWNFPAAMVTRSVASALAAGCTIALKPAEQSPLTALVLGHLWEEAGGPTGSFLILPCHRPQPVSTVLLHDHRIRKVTFTGSHAVGIHLYRESADTMKAISLELGGHAPFLIFEDADIDAAVNEAIACKFRYGGQTCVCTNRVYAHRDIAEGFAKAFVQAAAELKVGDPLDETTEVGPLIDRQGLDKVRHHIHDAVRRGASTTLNGRVLGGLYHEPTVLDSVTGDMAVMREETFGPVAPIATFEREEEAVRVANDTPFGLAAYFWTRDVGRTFRLIERLDAGIIGANDGVPGGNAHVPFGGTKESGLGRAGGRWGLEEFLEPSFVSLRLPSDRSF